MVTCWERANLLALLYVIFSCVFVTFLCGVLGQVWYLTLLTPDLCLLTYFEYCSFSLALNIKGFFLHKQYSQSYSPCTQSFNCITLQVDIIT